MSRKILFSLAMIAFAGAVIVGATGAFFSDTETSTGNTFTAGAIDLTIDSTATYNGSAWATSTWAMKNLVPTSDKFFNFDDVKPGDRGTNVISLHVANNDAYACLDITNLHNDGNGLTEPEDAVDNDADGAGQGELAQNLDFFAWVDIDGDGVFDPTASEVKLFSQASGIGQASDVLNGKTYTLADSTMAPMASNTTRFIGLAWCAGDMTVDLSTGATTCSGALMGNESQTDSVTADLSFRVEQSRNNEGFVCTAPTNGETSQKVGAKLSAYSAPSCSVTVQPGQSIQSALDTASAGQTVCIASGTHTTDTYPLRVSKDNLTLASVSGPAVTTLGGGVILDNDGTKVTGLTINDSTLLGATFGVYINTGVDGAIVSYNEIVGDDVSNTQGIVNAIGTTNNALIANNNIHDWYQGVFMNDSSGMTIEYNTVTSNAVGSANDHPVSNVIRYNHISGNTAEGVGILSSGTDSIVVNQNNLSGNIGDEELNSYGTNIVNAENNWWGDTNPSDDTSTPTLVDFTPFATSAFAQN